MEVQISFVNTIAMIIAGLFGWVGRTLWTATAELKDDIAKLKEDMPKTYVLKDDYRDDIKEIKEMLKGIQQDLKNKEDKIIR
jgi:hypothetical protein